MTAADAERLIDALWARHAMTDNAGTDGVRAELEALILAAYAQGLADGKKESQ